MQISKYEKDFDFLEKKLKELVDMSLDDFQDVINTHIQKMICFI